MKIALVITAKNERDILKSNILYHQYIGVDECHIFLDGSTDDTAATIGGIKNVHIQSTVDPAPYRDDPRFAVFIQNWDVIFTARQSLNTVTAIDRARAAGCDWLVAIDADELVCPDPHMLSPGCLKGLLASQPPHIQEVVFPTYEMVQRRMEYACVFRDEILFKRPGCTIRKQVYDPVRNTCFAINGFYGQKAGKCAIRLSANALPRNSHRFVTMDNRWIPNVKAGALLHFYCFEYRYFMAKYRGMADHPDTYQNGMAVEPQKRLWRDMVNNRALTEEYMRDYYRKYLLFSDQEIKKHSRRRWWQRSEPSIVEIPVVRRAFAAFQQ